MIGFAVLFPLIYCFKKKTFTWNIEKSSGAHAFISVSEIKPVVVPFPEMK